MRKHQLEIPSLSAIYVWGTVNSVCGRPSKNGEQGDFLCLRGKKRCLKKVHVGQEGGRAMAPANQRTQDERKRAVRWLHACQIVHKLKRQLSFKKNVSLSIEESEI